MSRASHFPISPIARWSLSMALLALSACASTGTSDADGYPPDVPTDAVPVTNTESNGDVVTQYLVGGKLRAVKVVPARGPTYYLYDQDGDGVADNQRDHPPATYFKLFEW